MPLKELERLQAVNKYLKININVEEELQAIAKTAADICDCSAAIITVSDEDKQELRFSHPPDFTYPGEAGLFYEYIISGPEFFIIEDLLKDKRFCNIESANSKPYIQFYAGVPLKTRDGYNLGSLYVMGQVPKPISIVNLKMLKMLAKHIAHILEFESGLRLLKKQFLMAKQTEVKLRSFFESSTSEHIMLDGQYKILAFNKRVRDIVQKEYNVLLEPGMKVTDFIHEDYMSDFIGNCKRALAGERIRHERLILFGSTSRWCELTYNPAKNSEDKILGVSYNCTDITDRVVQQNSMLKQHNLLMKTAFLQSHELRKPVANIKGILMLLKTDGHFNTYPALLDIENAADELDEKIRTIVSFTGV